MATTSEDVYDQLKQVFDPEIPVNIVDLGLVYDVKVEGPKALITMTLTSPALTVVTLEPLPAVAFLSGALFGRAGILGLLAGQILFRLGNLPEQSGHRPDHQQAVSRPHGGGLSGRRGPEDAARLTALW